MGWLNLVVGFVRLGPWVLFAIAGAILGAGVYLQTTQNTREAAKVVALQEGPPAAVAIDAFDRDTHATALREVVVRAQANMQDAYRLTLEENSGESYAYMVPLMAADATNDGVALGVALFTSSSFDFDDLTPELTLSGVSGFGALGPILDYNGKLTSLGKWDELTQEAMAMEGITMAASPVIVWPYLEGREAAMAPSDITMFGVFSKIAGGIALLALLKLVVRTDASSAPQAPRGNKADPFAGLQAARVSMPDPVVEPESAMTGVAARSPDGVPLWKQRAGLAQTGSSAVAYKASLDGSTPPMSAQAVPPVAEPSSFAQPVFDDPVFEEPVFDEPTFDTSPEPAPRRVKYEDPMLPKLDKPGRNWGMRHAAIGLVGAAFVALLISVLAGLLQKTTVNDQVAAIPTAEEFLAGTVADLVVPDADPNRHWTDIDITPVIEWVVAKGVLAATGDTDAMMTLAGLAVVPIVLMFFLRFYFATRSALRPRTTARFDSMGIN